MDEKIRVGFQTFVSDGDEEFGAVREISPDGTRIAFGGLRDNSSYGILVVNRDGTNLKRLVQGNDPAWSPDGSRIAFSGTQGFSIMFADGSGVRAIPTPGLYQGTQFNWSPDGSKIVFTGVDNINGGFNIYTINIQKENEWPLQGQHHLGFSVPGLRPGLVETAFHAETTPEAGADRSCWRG